MNRLLPICLGLFLLHSETTIASGDVPNFRVKQCGGDERIFQLSEHLGSWVLLDFLPPSSSTAENAFYTVVEASAEQLMRQRNLVCVFLKPNEEREVVSWWKSFPRHTLPVYRDPEGKLAEILKINPAQPGDGSARPPATLLVDPDGKEVWRHLGKAADDYPSLQNLLAQVHTAKQAHDKAEWGITEPGELIEIPSGLKYIDMQVGDGASPRPLRKVTVHYDGCLKNGRVFDSSRARGKPFTFRLGKGEVIKGWDEGVATMKVGGKRKLIIPPELGYGSVGKENIPPNSWLIFDVELLEAK